MQEKYMRYGRFLRSKRLADDRELTLKEVAEALGVSITFVSDVEHGRRLPYDEVKTEKAGYPEGVFVRPPIDPFFRYRHWYVFLEEIGQKIAETYGVSESAAYVHMKRCGLIRTEDPNEMPLYIRRGVAV